MKYYKIIKRDGHHGYYFKEGINIDPLPFYPYGIGAPGGFHISNGKDILIHLMCGKYIAECEPLSEVYFEPILWREARCKTHKINIGEFRDLSKPETWEWIINEGINLHYALSWAVTCNLLDIVKLLIANGAEVTESDYNNARDETKEILEPYVIGLEAK